MTEAVRLNKWQIALIAIGLSFLGGLSSGIRKKKERKLYEQDFKQAPWAPPAWLFAPVWTVNNFFLLMGLQNLLDNKDLPSHQKLLILQACIWLIFFSFGYVYFNKRSSLLAAIWTVSDAALAATSFIIANKDDKQLSYTYLPLLTWTAYASSVAVYQALKNPDPLLNIQPVL